MGQACAKKGVEVKCMNQSNSVAANYLSPEFECNHAANNPMKERQMRNSASMMEFS